MCVKLKNMRVDIPYLSRCCCCLPLRMGILIMAYINLLGTIFMSVMFIFGDMAIQRNYLYKMRQINPKIPVHLHSYDGLVSVCRLLTAIYLLNTILSVALITGCHKKSVNLMSLYYYYGIFESVFLFLYTFLNMDYLEFYFFEFGPFVLILTLFHGYFLLLIRTQIKKLSEENLCVRYENVENKLANNDVEIAQDKIYYPTVLNKPYENKPKNCNET